MQRNVKMEHNANSRVYERCHEFPALKDTVYVDHAGATLVARSQLEAHHKDILHNLYGNPHSRSQSSQLATDTIDQIRYRVLKHFHTTSDEYSVVFTAGCTAALKLVAECFNYHGNCCQGDVQCTSTSRDCNIHVTSSGVDVQNLENDICEISTTEESQKFCCHGDEHCSYGDEPCNYGDEPCNPGDEPCNHGKGSFSYLFDNHTSAQGMRELAFQRAGRVQCLDIEHGDALLVKSILLLKADALSCGNHLFVYPAQSNFTGRKYPLRWINEVKQGQMEWQSFIGTDRSRSHYCQGHMYTVLDAASFVSTSPLNLGMFKPDFVTLSFYKMFGYPTGLGALLVRNESAHVLKKTYFGGGTVSVSLPNQSYHVSRSSISERFEDGTVPFLDIIALRHGFDVLDRVAGGIKNITQQTFNLAQYFYCGLSSCRHNNGSRFAEIYCDGCYDNIDMQGAIVSFNLLRENGEYVGFSEVDKLAQLYNIHVRTGCFCNIGACQKYLNMTDDQIKHNFDSGHVCGDDQDLVDGRPTGAVRVSFGYMSSFDDVSKCLQFIVDCFLTAFPKPVYWDSNINVNQSVSKNRAALECTTFRAKEELSGLKEEFDDTTKLTEVEAIPEKHETENLNDEATDKDETCIDDKTCAKEVVVRSRPGDTDAGDGPVFSPCEGRHLTDIFLYPVKSCAAFKVNKWPVCDRGLLYDRGWMIVTESGIAMSQKREPRLCLLQPTIDLQNQSLVLNYPGMENISVTLEQGKDNIEITGNLCNSKVCGDRVHSLDCGSAVGEWLSEAFGRPGCRLVRQATDDTRASKMKQNPDTTGKLSLANESQYLLISRDSVSELYDRILERRENGETQDCSIDDVDNLLDRFRGNLVVSGCKSFEEESWNAIQVGNLIFKSQGTCTRCQMVCFDQQTGERCSEPLKTLAVWRGTKVPFGIHLSIEISQHPSTSQSVVAVGDPVFIL